MRHGTVLRYVMLCYVMLCYVMLCYVCYVMLCYFLSFCLCRAAPVAYGVSQAKGLIVAVAASYARATAMRL